MRSKTFFISFFSLFLLGTTTSFAQNTIEVTGTVTDETGEAIIGANVVVKDVAGLGVITDINGHAAEEVKARPTFDSFTAIYPKKRINLSGRSQDAALRLIDLLCPIGFGQRALITCENKAQGTEMLKKLAAAVCRNYPKAQMKVLLVNGVRSSSDWE